MTSTQTPDWLTETQNKSWEPEILISGIMLTFIFVLSTQLYNFFGMLVQDFAVFDKIAQMLYIISSVILTGLKVILVVHLVLRGVWTGFVGLSYVFPLGVKREKLSPGYEQKQFRKPADFVIQIERVASLLFSFIFSSITLFSSVLVFLLPILALFFIGLPLPVIRWAILSFTLVILLASALVLMLSSRSAKVAGLYARAENAMFSNVLAIYMTNIGRLKTLLLFVCYFAVVAGLSWRSMASFPFVNDEPAVVMPSRQAVVLDRDHYGDMRPEKKRISKAALASFNVESEAAELSISCYHEDLLTLQRLIQQPETGRQFNITGDASSLDLPDLYRLSIDGVQVRVRQWYRIEHSETGQPVIFAELPVSQLSPGRHTLVIDKVYWYFRKSEMKWIKNWDVIPFEVK